MAEFEINKTKLSIDFADADECEKVEKAVLKAKTVIDEIKLGGLSNSQVIKKVCSAISDCFDNIFGENTGKQVLGEKHNYVVALKAFEQILIEKDKQEKSIQNEFQSIIKQYSPNRLERRHTPKK